MICYYSIKFWGFWHSHSGNFCYRIELKHRITIDNVSVKKKKNVWLVKIELTEKYCLALVEIPAFSGNDYTSSFFKRSKEKMLEDIDKFPKFLTDFNTLCTSQEWHGDLFDQLEEFVCFVYGSKIKNINNLDGRNLIKSFREYKVADSVSLLPYKQFLLYPFVYDISGGTWVCQK